MNKLPMATPFLNTCIVLCREVYKAKRKRYSHYFYKKKYRRISWLTTHTRKKEYSGVIHAVSNIYKHTKNCVCITVQNPLTFFFLFFFSLYFFISKKKKMNKCEKKRLPSIDQLVSSLQDHLALKDATSLLLNTSCYGTGSKGIIINQDFVLYNDIQYKTKKGLKLLPDLR
jgi:hypothetical protein